MPSAKPSLELLRSLTETHILWALMNHGRLTRAEISARTGISKPTISVGVRRLVNAEILYDTGEFSTGRGRAGNYYDLAPTCGAGLTVMIAPGAVIAETIDPFGTVTSSATVELDRSPGAEGAKKALVAAAKQAIGAQALPIRTSVVSAADPVDRRTGRLVQLPDAPFMVGELDPPAALAPLVNGPVLVDNDVNWAARAESEAADLPDPDNFAYLYLGEGLGFAVVSNGEVWRGHSGVAGEVAHVITRGPRGEAMPFTQVFASLRLRRRASTAIHVDRVLATLADKSKKRTVDHLAAAVAGVLTAAVGLADPSAAVIGGTWGRNEVLLAAVQRYFTKTPRALVIQPSVLHDRAELVGARNACLDALRNEIVAAIPSLP